MNKQEIEKLGLQLHQALTDRQAVAPLTERNLSLIHI